MAERSERSKPEAVDLEIQLNNELAASSANITRSGLQFFAALSNAQIGAEVPHDYPTHRERINELPTKMAA